MIYCKKAGGSCHSDACTLKGDCVTTEDHFHYFRRAAAETEAHLNEEIRRLIAENAELLSRITQAKTTANELQTMLLEQKRRLA